MVTLFYTFFGIGVACAVGVIISLCVKKARQNFIHLYFNIALAVCAVICGAINISI